jgi:hypothetical protein
MERRLPRLLSSAVYMLEMRQSIRHLSSCRPKMIAARAVLQFMCSIEFRARRLFLKGKATYHRAFGAQQLENSSIALGRCLSPRKTNEMA